MPVFPPDVVEPNGFDAALRGMRDREFLSSRNWQEQQWRADREGAHPDLLEFEKVFVRRMAKLGVPMFAAECVRTPEHQNDLYALGNTRAKGGQSAHQFGCAVDIVHSTKAWGLTREQWLLCGHVGQELITQKGLQLHSLAWGGEWSFYDPAHWEVADWKTIKGEYPWPTK